MRCVNNFKANKGIYVLVHAITNYLCNILFKYDSFFDFIFCALLHLKHVYLYSNTANWEFCSSRGQTSKSLNQKEEVSNWYLIETFDSQTQERKIILITANAMMQFYYWPPLWQQKSHTCGNSDRIRGEPIIGKTSANLINRPVFSQSADCLSTIGMVSDAT